MQEQANASNGKKKQWPTLDGEVVSVDIFAYYIDVSHAIDGSADYSVSPLLPKDFLDTMRLRFKADAARRMEKAREDFKEAKRQLLSN